MAERRVIARTLLVQHDEVRAESSHAPVLMGLQELANHVETAIVGNRHHHNRQIARYAESPQSGLAQPVSRDAIRRAKADIRIQQIPCQLLKAMRARRT